MSGKVTLFCAMTIEQLEQQLMAALLSGEDARLAALRAQYRSATVGARQFTGVGFFTHFVLPGAVPLVTPLNFEIADVFLQLAGVAHGAMAILFIRESRLDCLEVVTLDDPWPEQIAVQSLYYSPPHSALGDQVRDLEALRQSWKRR